ncbi:uncharacterized protein VTP21DRAFT_1840 [Calcarisporiella thermophila]|uniref:uncharacterized protein n=1 Tax=Calcarisporiella thermophila TaxID=911321 RepID=UPI003743D350
MAESYLVVGGNGFLGRHIVDQLVIKRSESPSLVDRIVVFDLNAGDTPNVEYIVGDLRKYEDVVSSCKDISVVIHTASPLFTAGKEILYQVNILGTQNVIKACREAGVKKLVYTSSGSVIFQAGEPKMVNGDETTPYPDVHIDDYSASKAEAERLVVAANDPPVLYSAVIRPTGIFGPHDRLAIPRMIQVAKNNQHRFQIGNNTALSDFTYVENLAEAHLLAAEKLIAVEEVNGQIFNITNGTPIYFWDFAHMVWALMGIHFTPIVIPYHVSLVLAFFIEIVGEIKAKITGKAATPGLTRANIRHATRPRYLNIEKARRLLGYDPKIDLAEGLRRSLRSFGELKEQQDEKKKK